MYRILGLAALLKYFAWLALALAVVVAWYKWPIASLGQALSIGLSGVSLAALAVAGVGETPLFPWLCRRLPLSLIFPDIEGEWVGVTRSNWPIVSRKLAASDEKARAPELLETKVQVRFTCRLSYVTMELVSKDGYSNSETLAVQITRRNTARWGQIAYVFRNTTPVPEITDNDGHLGAGCLDIIKTTDNIKLEGRYWTNRKWTEGLNTAGEIVLQRKR
jgi:hypothetical protein